MRDTKNFEITRGGIGNQLALLAAPLILGNIFQQFYNMADSFIIGRYISHTAFAAAGVAGNIMNLFIFVINGGCNGISIIFAELYGEKNRSGLKKESFLSFSSGCFAAVGMGIAGVMTLDLLLNILRTHGDVKIFAREYLLVIYAGLPAAFI